MHINYLLKRFPKTEWSGPAWYKLEEDKWNLVHFIPIDLGSHSATEFKGKDLLKIMKEVQKTVDVKDCFQGIIHSHHGMGAFHSGTDDTELEEGANRVGYPSLVVAHTKATHAFKYSYEDQFGEVHLVDGEVVIQMPAYKAKDTWITQADKIEKAAKKKPKVITYSGANQTSLWNGKKYNGWGGYIDQEEVKYNEKYEKMQEAELQYASGTMSRTKYKKAKKEWETFESDHFGII
tara:strand:- start:96 stop:800 length:705 start_codon:yes stop_codon:yes gene_type:complete